jgi:hypothetical protein
VCVCSVCTFFTSRGLLPSVGASGQWYLPLTSTPPPLRWTLPLAQLNKNSALLASNPPCRILHVESSMSNPPCRTPHVEHPMSNTPCRTPHVERRLNNRRRPRLPHRTPAHSECGAAIRCTLRTRCDGTSSRPPSPPTFPVGLLRRRRPCRAPRQAPAALPCRARGLNRSREGRYKDRQRGRASRRKGDKERHGES